MKRKFGTILMIAAFCAAAFGQKAKPAAAKPDPLLEMLPKSDAVLTLDVTQLLTRSLPQILASDKSSTDDVNKAIEDLKTQTGIDLRSFTRLAAALNVAKISDKNVDVEPLFVAISKADTKPAIDAVIKAGGDKLKTENVAGRSVYIITAEAVAANKPTATNKKVSSLMDSLFAGLKGEIAVVQLNSKTIAFGKPESVRTAVAPAEKLSAELKTLMKRGGADVINFAAKMPFGFSSFLPLDNDDLGKNIDSIQFIQGSLGVLAQNTSLHLTAKMIDTKNATELLDTLQGLQSIGKAFLKGNKKKDNQVFGRMIDNVKLARQSATITFDLSVPQSDIDALLGS